MNKERALLLILACINFTHIMDFMIMMPLGPQLMRIFDINPKQFSLLVSSYTFTAGFASFLAAFFVDRFNRKHVLLLGYGGFIAGTFACAMAPNFGLLLAARVLTGLFGGLIGAQVLSIVSDSISYDKRARAMGIVMTGFSVASVAGVPFGLFMAAEYGWHAPFLFVGSISILIFLLVWIKVPDMKGHLEHLVHNENRFAVITDIAKNKNQLRALLLMMVLMIGHFSIIPLIAQYMVGNVGFTEHQLSYIYLVGGALTIFTAPLIGRLADRFGKFPVLTVFIFLSLIPTYLITNIRHLPISLVLCITASFFVFAGGRIIPVQAMISATVTPQRRGSFMNINSSLQQISTGIASLAGGMIVQKTPSGSLVNYNYVGYLAMTASLFCIVIAKKLKPVN